MRHPISIAQSLWRAWTRRLRILARPSSVLLLALCFAFAEPLACIIHCQVYVPWLLRHQHVHQRSQAPKRAAATLGGSPPAHEMFVALAAELPANPNCFRAGDGSTPTIPGVPPSPVHELILVVLLVLAGMAAVFSLPARAPPPPRTCGTAPLTPPPRCSSA